MHYQFPADKGSSVDFTKAPINDNYLIFKEAKACYKVDCSVHTGVNNSNTGQLQENKYCDRRENFSWNKQI